MQGKGRWFLFAQLFSYLLATNNNSSIQTTPPIHYWLGEVSPIHFTLVFPLTTNSAYVGRNQGNGEVGEGNEMDDKEMDAIIDDINPDDIL